MNGRCFQIRDTLSQMSCFVLVREVTTPDAAAAAAAAAAAVASMEVRKIQLIFQI